MEWEYYVNAAWDFIRYLINLPVNFWVEIILVSLACMMVAYLVKHAMKFVVTIGVLIVVVSVAMQFMENCIIR